MSKLRKQDSPTSNRDRTKLLPAVVFGATFCAILVGRAPATLVTAAAGLDRSAIGYEGVEGTVWKGALRGVSVDGVRLGDVDFRASPLSLLRGVVEFEVASRNGALEGDGVFSVDVGGRLRAHRVSAAISLDAFRSLRALGQPLQGRAHVAIQELSLSRRGCVSASGRVKTDAAVSAAEAFGRKGFDMEGPISCRDGEALLRLEGQGDGLKAMTEIRIQPGFKIATVASLNGADAQMSMALEGLGFRNEGGVWRTETGGLAVGGS